MIAVPTITMKDELAEVAAANKITPVTQEFDESKGVAGRVNSITSSGSPLMEKARTRAAQASAKRGLQNSSIGVQAGEQAVIETATPIASADANLYQQQRLTNQTAQNNAAVVNANNAIGAATTGRQMDLQDGQQRASLMEQARQFNESRSENARQFDATTTQRERQLGENARQFDASLGQRASEFGVTSGQSQQQIDAQREQFAQQLGLSRSELDLRRDQLTTSQQQFLAELDQRERQLGENARQFDATTAQREVLAKMDVDSRKELATIEANFKNQIQNNTNISQAWGTMMDTIKQIQNNPELDANTKSTLIQNNLDAFKSFSSFWQKASGGAVDVSDLLNFGMVNAGGPPGSGGGSGTPGAPGYNPAPGVDPSFDNGPPGANFNP